MRESGNNRDLLRVAGIATFGAMLLGSCSGMLLANYTVAGMSDFYSRSSPFTTTSMPEQGTEAASRYPELAQQTAAAIVPDYPEDATLAATYREDGRY